MNTMPKLKVAILLDPANNWIEKYIKDIRDIKELSARYHFHFYQQPKEIKNFEIVLILGYTKILSKEFLRANRLNIVIHESNLPEGKGFSPLQWQILEEKNNIPVCLFEAAEEVDTGDILERSFIKLSGDE